MTLLLVTLVNMLKALSPVPEHPSIKQTPVLSKRVKCFPSPLAKDMLDCGTKLVGTQDSSLK